MRMILFGMQAFALVMFRNRPLWHCLESTYALLEMKLCALQLYWVESEGQNLSRVAGHPPKQFDLGLLLIFDVRSRNLTTEL